MTKRTDPEVRAETVWMILDNEQYHINDGEQHIWCVGIFQHSLRLAHHHLHITQVLQTE